MSLDHRSLVSSLRNLQYPEQWITGIGCTSAMVIATSVAMAVVELIPSDNRSLLGILIPIVSTPIITFAIWWAGRHLYFKSGSGRRIGIAFDGHRFPIEDWVRTRRRLSDLCNDTTVEQHLTLRLIPSRYCSTPDRTKRTQEALRLDVLIRAIASLNMENKRADFKFECSHHVKAQLTKAFLDVTAKSMAILSGESRTAKSIAEAFDLVADDLFEIVVLQLSMACTIEEDFESARALFTVLEERLSHRFKVDQEPRRVVRWMHSRCFLQSSKFSSASPPGPDHLDQAIREVSEAIDLYAAQFPDLHHVQARNQFFRGNLDESRRHAQAAYDAAGNAKERATGALDLAVLCLFAAEYHNARDKFIEWRDSDAFKTFDLSELMAFADTAREFGFASAVFIQAYYRALRGDTSLPTGLDGDAVKWLSADGGRAGLKTLLGKTPLGKKLWRRQSK